MFILKLSCIKDLLSLINYEIFNILGRYADGRITPNHGYSKTFTSPKGKLI